MRMITRVTKAMQRVLVEKANKLAVETGFMERERVLTGSSFVSGLMSGWQSNPKSSLEGLSQAVGNAGTPISRQGLAKRFDQKAVVLLKAVLEVSLEEMVSALPISKGLLSRFSNVDLVDSSIITLPNKLESVWQGSGGFGDNARVSSLKLNVRLDVRSGQLKTLELSNGRQHDRRSVAYKQKVNVGSLQIADLGYFNLDDFAAIAAQDAYWLSRYKVDTNVYDLDGQAIDLAQWLPQTIANTIDTQVLLGKTKQLLCRLVAERAPLEVIEQRHERIHETARQNQTTATKHSLEMAQWTIYITNVPHTLLGTQEVFILGRYRWQIELLFKLWKSDLGVDDWTSENPYRILSEIYTKLLGAIVTHWFLLVACWHNPRTSFRLAMPTIHGLAWQFANSLTRLSLLKHAFNCLCRSLSKFKVGKSRADPRAWQLIYEHFA